jgi:dephospho-CoA kinase
MQVDPSNIYFIVGHHGSGKSFLCKLLEEYCKGILHLECGPTIRSLYQQSGSNLSFKAWVQIHESKYGNDFTELAILKEFKKQITAAEKHNTILITGSRAIKHIECFSKGFDIKKPSVIFVDSSFELKKANYEKREKIVLSKEEFQTLLDDDSKMGLDDLKVYVQANLETCFMLYNFDNDSDKLLQQMLKIVKIPLRLQ